MRASVAARPLVGGPGLGRASLVIGAGIILVVVAALTAIAVGSTEVGLGDAIGILAQRLGIPVTESWAPTAPTILFEVRLPRVLAGIVVGAGLGAAGVVFQALLRNPMADPYVIGAAAGASLGAVLAITAPIILPVLAVGAGTAWLGIGLVQVAAFVGGLGAVAIVLAVARQGGRSSMVTLLLTGYAVSSLLAAGTALLLVNSGRAMSAVVGWLLGSLGGAGYPELAIAAPLVIGGSALLLVQWRTLNLLLLGDEAAAGLGVDLVPARRGLVLLATIVTSAAVALAGTIGFVGLVVPHLVRLVLGPDHRLLLPASCLGGAALLVTADLVARVAGGVPVGVVTALIGAPFFLWLLHRAATASTAP
ncbi:MAG TPA: iron chelate uptake ABC transporter family permease subunit [Candidatus Limnocylindria bacterium]|jgi:iron complex transport system permease protein